MSEPNITETTLEQAMREIERATLSECHMCDLHHVRERRQREVIEILESECARRSGMVEESRREKSWLWAAVLLLACAFAYECLKGAKL